MINTGGLSRQGCFYESCLPLPSSPALSFSSHDRCLPGSTVWVVMTACLPNESIFLLLMLCIYTHCNLPYKPQRREERERAREREGKGGRREREKDRDRASKPVRKKEEREKEKQKETERERGTDKALLPDSRQPSFPYPAKCNSSNAATGSVFQTNRVKKVYSIALLLANKQFKSSWLHLLYLCSIMRNVLFQLWHNSTCVIIINTFLHISRK